MYRTRYISLGLVDRDVTVTLVTVTVDPGPRGLDPAGPAVGIKGRGGVYIKLVGIKFRPRPPERGGAGGGHQHIP